MLNKLKDFKADYEIFAGSPGEFYQHYQITASPSLKSGKTLISGKTAILKLLKKDTKICS